MRRIKKLFVQYLSASLSLSLALTGIWPLPPVYADVLPQPSHSNLSADLSKFRLPSALGKVDELKTGKDGRVVVLIQDAHAIPDAQGSIQKTIAYLREVYGIQHVAIEGTANRLDPTMFKSFPDKVVLKKLFKEYFDRGELTGPSAAALFNPGREVYEGAEDWPVYEQGLALYLAALDRQPGLLNFLNSQKENLEKEKRKIYSEKLLRADLLISRFFLDQADLLSTLQGLAEFEAPPQGSDLVLMLDEAKREGAGQAGLEMELKALAEEVLGSSRRAGVSADEEKLFNQKNQEFRTGQVPTQAFAVFLKQFCGRNGLKVRFSKELLSSANKQVRLEQIEGTRFFRDFKAYTQRLKGNLFENEKQKALDQMGEQAALLERLALMKLDQEDWQQVSSGNLIIQNAAFLEDLLPAVAFYQNAKKRDDILFRNLMRQMEASQTSAGIIVAGGFHTEGLSRRLTEAGTSFVVIMPGIRDLPKESRYVDQMRGDVSWRDALKVENGKIDLYGAFVRYTRDRLLAERTVSPQNSRVTLKLWRDQILRDLAAEGRLDQAAQYTRFLDESVDSQKDGGDLKTAWLKNTENFMGKIKDLQSKQQLSQTNVAKLFAPSGMASAQVAGALAPNASLPAASELTSLDLTEARQLLLKEAGVRPMVRPEVRTSSVLTEQISQMNELFEQLKASESLMEAYEEAKKNLASAEARAAQAASQLTETSSEEDYQRFIQVSQAVMDQLREMQEMYQKGKIFWEFYQKLNVARELLIREAGLYLRSVFPSQQIKDGWSFEVPENAEELLPDDSEWGAFVAQMDAFEDLKDDILIKQNQMSQRDLRDKFFDRVTITKEMQTKTLELEKSMAAADELYYAGRVRRGAENAKLEIERHSLLSPHQPALESLFTALQKDSFVALAGQLQRLHQDLKADGIQIENDAKSFKKRVPVPDSDMQLSLAQIAGLNLAAISALRQAAATMPEGETLAGQVQDFRAFILQALKQQAFYYLGTGSSGFGAFFDKFAELEYPGAVDILLVIALEDRSEYSVVAQQRLRELAEKPGFIQAYQLYAGAEAGSFQLESLKSKIPDIRDLRKMERADQFLANQLARASDPFEKITLVRAAASLNIVDPDSAAAVELLKYAEKLRANNGLDIKPNTVESVLRNELLEFFFLRARTGQPEDIARLFSFAERLPHDNALLKIKELYTLFESYYQIVDLPHRPQVTAALNQTQKLFTELVLKSEVFGDSAADIQLKLSLVQAAAAVGLVNPEDQSLAASVSQDYFGRIDQALKSLAQNEAALVRNGARGHEELQYELLRHDPSREHFEKMFGQRFKKDSGQAYYQSALDKVKRTHSAERAKLQALRESWEQAKLPEAKRAAEKKFDNLRRDMQRRAEGLILTLKIARIPALSSQNHAFFSFLSALSDLGKETEVLKTIHDRFKGTASSTELGKILKALSDPGTFRSDSDRFGAYGIQLKVLKSLASLYELLPEGTEASPIRGAAEKRLAADPITMTGLQAKIAQEKRTAVAQILGLGEEGALKDSVKVDQLTAEVLNAVLWQKQFQLEGYGEVLKIRMEGGDAAAEAELAALPGNAKQALTQAWLKGPAPVKNNVQPLALADIQQLWQAQFADYLDELFRSLADMGLTVPRDDSDLLGTLRAASDAVEAFLKDAKGTSDQKSAAQRAQVILSQIQSEQASLSSSQSQQTDVTLEVSQDVIERHNLGVGFPSCLNLVTGVNRHYSIATAMDLDKRVIFVKSNKGKRIARLTLGLSADGTAIAVTSRFYRNTDLDLMASLIQFLKDYAVLAQKPLYIEQGSKDEHGVFRGLFTESEYKQLEADPDFQFVGAETKFVFGHSVTPGFYTDMAGGINFQDEQGSVQESITHVSQKGFFVFSPAQTADLKASPRAEVRRESGDIAKLSTERPADDGGPNAAIENLAPVMQATELASREIGQIAFMILPGPYRILLPAQAMSASEAAAAVLKGLKAPKGEEVLRKEITRFILLVSDPSTLSVTAEAEAKALLASLERVSKDQTYTIGAILPLENNQVGPEFLTAMVRTLKNRDVLDGVIAAGKGAPMSQLMEVLRGVVPIRQVPPNHKPLILNDQQKKVPMVFGADKQLIFKIYQTLNESFFPVSADSSKEDDPFIRNYVEVLKVVAAVHTADLMAHYPELLTNPEELKQKLFERLFVAENQFVNMLQVSGQGIGVSSTVARVYLSWKAAQAAAEAA